MGTVVAAPIAAIVDYLTELLSLPTLSNKSSNTRDSSGQKKVAVRPRFSFKGHSVKRVLPPSASGLSNALSKSSALHNFVSSKISQLQHLRVERHLTLLSSQIDSASIARRNAQILQVKNENKDNVVSDDDEKDIDEHFDNFVLEMRGQLRNAHHRKLQELITHWGYMEPFLFSAC